MPSGWTWAVCSEEGVTGERYLHTGVLQSAIMPLFVGTDSPSLSSIPSTGLGMRSRASSSSELDSSGNLGGSLTLRRAFDDDAMESCKVPVGERGDRGGGGVGMVRTGGDGLKVKG